MTEGLIEFVYQVYITDVMNGRVNVNSWLTFHGLMNVCMSRWQDHATTDRQRLMVGLIHLVQASVYSRTSSINFRDMSRRMDQLTSTSPAPPSVPPPPYSVMSSTTSMGLVPPSSAAHGGTPNHPTPPLISPEPSPRASSSTSSPSPSVVGHHASSSISSHPSHGTPNPHAPSQPSYLHHPQQSQHGSTQQPRPPPLPEVWDLLRHTHRSAKGFADAHAMLNGKTMGKFFPVTWGRCLECRFGIREGMCVSLAACAKEDPISSSSTSTFGPASSSATGSTSASATSPFSPSSLASTPLDTGSGGKEEGEAEEAEEGEMEEDGGNATAVSTGGEEEPEVAGWYWPVMSGDHVPHMVGFAKSLLWEFARAEVGASGTKEAYRGDAGVNVDY
ncbi:uncharacterized protein EI90DRAFT_1318376 [Cantharellus anzutake]|uniref:uncharacterized protein n=1 Tax=Cantharellus anzutake TaxID=1750568 RepID=UPI001905A13C|nr:uncharacterized protein EI90DRAFT_1318376 [Cantharellus anzutake]KAF8342232.1 hypothetical protein EI90DRAFT_1318376 [Cantharellus anzutake]